jgi:hypothetical protein
VNRTFSMQKRTSRSNAPEVKVGERSEPGVGRALRDPEVVERAMRRKFGAEYKLHILKLADSCTEPGSLGVLLRRRNVSTTLRHPFGEFSVACVLKNTPIMSGSRYAPRCGGCAPRLPGLSPFPGIFKPYLTFPENYLEEG